MSNLSAIEHFILSIPSKIKHFVDNPKVEQAFGKIAEEVNVLLPYAIKAVQIVEAQSGNRTVAEVGAVLKQLGVLATVDPNTPANDPTIKGLLLQAASAALHGQLKAAVNEAGQAGFKLGKELITDANSLPSGSLLDAAVQIAFTFLSKGAGTTLLAGLV